MRPDGTSMLQSGAALVLDGIAGSAGYAIGHVVIVDTRRSGIVRRHIVPEAAAEELSRFDDAVVRSAGELRVVLAAKQGKASRAETSILEAYVLMLEDETLRAAVESKIASAAICAEWALDLAVADMAAVLRQSGDPYLAERSHDFEFVEDRLLRTMAGKQGAVVLPKDGTPSVLVAHDLSPAETAGLTKERVLAIVTEVGTRTSHTAILARALEIPAVVGVPNLLSRVGTGDVIVVDGVHGQVAISPTETLIADTNARAGRFSDIARHRREARDRPIRTRCGQTVELRANIELPSEAEGALEQGARGIGLVPHGVLVPRPQRTPERRRAIRNLPSRGRGAGAVARHFAHLRHRRGQVRVRVPGSVGDEPGARLARGAPRLGSAGHLSDAAARDGACFGARPDAGDGADDRVHGRVASGQSAVRASRAARSTPKVRRAARTSRSA